MTTHPWYKLLDENDIDSPALIVYKDRVVKNIETLINSIDDIKRLRPHIKTHKSAEVSKMFIDRGITKFKCATIAEAEILAGAGAEDILLAYQPVGPKIDRFFALINMFPAVHFSCLVDNASSAAALSKATDSFNHNVDYFIDLNVGMNRTGIDPDQVPAFYETIKSYAGISLRGLHVYDGHIRDADFAVRKRNCDDAFQKVEKLAAVLENGTQQSITIVAGGTPTYSVHCKRKNIECSPGTFIYWDKGYETILAEQHYLHAAVVLTRVISKPAKNTICVDLGHKSIASENALDQRVYFLNADGLKPIGHSEEHMILQNNGDLQFEVGDALYGIPYHVCPTIALYERTNVAMQHRINDTWFTVSRNRKITI